MRIKPSIEIRDPDAFAVIASGSSMGPYLISEGHMCFCEPGLKPKRGDIICLERRTKSGKIELSIKTYSTALGDYAIEIYGYKMPYDREFAIDEKDEYELIDIIETQEIFWETIPTTDIERISPVTFISTRPIIGL